MLAKSKKICRGPLRNSGSMLITLIITIVIFSVLAVAMLSLTGTSIFGQLNTSSTTKATYIAKSGYRYLASQYKNATPATEAQRDAARNLALDTTLHDKTFQLQGSDGSFHLNVKPYYLMSKVTRAITNAVGVPLNVKFPGAEAFIIPTSTGNKTMAVYIPGTGWRRFYYTTRTGSANDYYLTLSTTDPPDGQPINLIPGTSIVPVLALSSNQTITNGGNLTVATGTGGIFPARFGFFEVPRVAAASNFVFRYDRRTGDVLYNIQDANTPGRTFSYATATTTRFIFSHTSAEISSTGTFNGPGPAVSNTFSRMAILGFNPGAADIPHNITGVDGWASIGTGVAVDTTNQQLQLGRSQTDTAGVIWYAGDSEAANCQTGLCDFGLGVRAYFDFRDTTGSTSSGDGFMFMMMNGTNNDTTKRGGTVSGSGMGELMGYAGPGNSADGLGLQPPKISVEFDRYYNAGVSGTPTGAGCSNGRNDATGNHMALMFWGNNTGGTCTGGINNGCLAMSYDDNIHSMGVEYPAADYNITPINSYTGTCSSEPRAGPCGYSAQTFSNTNTRPVRIEVTRAATPNVRGNYEYNIQVWIWTTTCSGAGCADVTLPFTASTPQINRTIELSDADETPLHRDFHKMFFGFTQGTGSATQNILISNFNIYFIPY